MALKGIEMQTITRLAVLCCLLVGGMGSAHADQWERLGTRAVNFLGDRDVIPVGLKGKYKKIKIKVTGNAIHIADLKVHFANGGVHDVAVRSNIPKGGETRVIDLPGAARVITKITVVYRTKIRKPRRRGKAHFTVFGKKATGAAPVAKPPVKPTPKAAPAVWVHLGTRDVKFGAEQDVIPVTAASGVFKRVKFKVRNNAIHMIDMKVFFGNGQTQDVPLRFNIPKGGESRVIDLPGTARVIKKIRLRYKSHGGLKGLVRGHAKIDVYGKKVVGSAAAPRPTPKPAVPKPTIGKWQKLGERTVKPRVEKDVIRVGVADGRFTKLKFRVKTAPVRILDMKVHFKNGEVKDVALRAVIPAGGESRVIDLPGNKRFITHVTFWYKEKGKARLRPGRPHVALWGRH